MTEQEHSTAPTDPEAVLLHARRDACTDFVLLVDDQPMVGEAVRRIVADMEGFDYHYVVDPHLAIEAILDIQPTVVLLDLMMPGKDGLTLLREIRQHPSLNSIPVVMLSTTEAPETKVSAFEAGTDDYLIKIPARTELQARLRYHSRAYKMRFQRDEALRSLRESQRRLQELNLQLLHLSQADGLTGLSNRRHYDEVLSEELRRSERNNIPLTLILIDVDHFKRYNDLYGHQEGDRCLQRVAALLRSKAQRGGEVAARYGGEEFALILPHCDEAHARGLAAALQEAMAELAIEHGQSVAPHVSLSMGVVTKLSNGKTSPDQLTAAADRVLYRVKAAGRNGFEWEAI